MWMLLWGEMRRRWPEHLAVVAAVALVVAALVAQRAVAGAADEAMHEMAHRLGRNMLVVPADMDLAGFHRQEYGDTFLPDDAPATLLRSPAGPHLRAIQARLHGRADVGGAPLLLVGEARPWPTAPEGVVPAVLGAEAARRLGAARGSRLEAGPLALSVLDVIADADQGLDEAVFVPLEAGQRILGRPGQVNALRLAGCWCRIDVAALAREVERNLPGSRAVTATGLLEAQVGSVAAVRRYSGILVAVGASMVAVLAGAVVAAQARRRRKEIGLLVAVGAPPGRIAGAMTMLAATLAGAGALAGWALAAPVLAWLGAGPLGAVPAVPTSLLPAAVVGAAGVAALAASFPAWRAARLDPTDVLREV